MNGSLNGQTVLVIGRGSGIARAVALATRDAGATVVVAGRDQEKLSGAYAGEPGISLETVDLTDEASIAGLGERLGTAYKLATGDRLASGDFEGGKSGAVKVLGTLGFTVQLRSR